MGRAYLWVAALIVVLDQASKIWASQALSQKMMIVYDWFNLRLAHNYGAAWNILANAGGWQRWFLSALSLGVSVYLIIWLWRLPEAEKKLALPLALILGGAIGNLIDRAYQGYVVDFVQWHYGGWYFPTFNIADVGITLGAIGLILTGFFTASDTKASTT